MAYPQLLPSRNPRSASDRAYAFDIIKALKKGSLRITTKSKEELARVGIRPSTYVVKDRISKDDLGVGMFFFLEEGLIKEDNYICCCDGCSHPIQFRPYFRPVKKYCVFCCAQQILTEYHVSKRHARSAK